MFCCLGGFASIPNWLVMKRRPRGRFGARWLVRKQAEAGSLGSLTRLLGWLECVHLDTVTDHSSSSRAQIPQRLFPTCISILEAHPPWCTSYVRSWSREHPRRTRGRSEWKPSTTTVRSNLPAIWPLIDTMVDIDTLTVQLLLYAASFGACLQNQGWPATSRNEGTPLHSGCQ